MTTPATFSAGALQRWTEDALLAVGTLPAAAAADTARLLVRTNLRGIDTHGIARLPMYLTKLASGEVNPRAAPTLTWREPALLEVDGDGGLGQFVGLAAMRELARAAQEQTIACALIRRSGHLGALGLFALELAEQGLVAMVCQDTPPLMALQGSKSAAIGNNPLAFAAPLKDRAPLVFDMAASIVARGNVLQAQRDGATIPEGWAIGPDGEPTTDAATALKGAMLPMAGHKGIGLAMLVQVLAGSLNGLAASAPSASGSPANVSGFALVINPARLLGRPAFDAHMDAWLATYLAAGGDSARYPGQRAAAEEQRRAAEGLALPASVVNELRAAGASVGCPFIE